MEVKELKLEEKNELVPCDGTDREPAPPVEDVGCGIGDCHPKSLRCLSILPVFISNFATSSLLASTLIVYVNSQITTLERQFGFNSSQTGIIMAANDIGFLASTLVFGYLAPRIHIPRWLSMSAILYGVSGIICSLPHFLFGIESTISSESTEGGSISTGQLCSTVNQSNCLSDGSTSEVTPSFGISGYNAKISLWIIIAGMVLQGLAKGPRHPFIISYLDNNTEKSNTGFMLGIVIGLSIFGPAVAFTLGGYFSKIYVTLEDVDIGPRHPRWIGAWWLGYIVFGVTAIIVGIPLFFYPKYLNNRTPNPDDGTTSKLEFKSFKSFVQNVKHFCWLLGKILTNPVYVMLQITSCVHMFAVAGSRAFLPKYVENQFSLPSWKTNLILAGLSLTTASIGTFIGGWITKKFKFTPLGNLKYVIIVNTIILFLKCFGFVFGCDQPEIQNMPGTSEMNLSCYDNCSCNDQDFFPICSEYNHNFYSPCHAGCLVSDGNTYTNCSCIPTGRATAGFCPTSCVFLYPYVVMSALVTLIGTTCIMPKYITMIRCVPEDHKTLGTALTSFNSSLFGWLLGPVVYGKVIDSICLVWDKKCDGGGSCALYDIIDFRYKFHGFVVGADAISVILLAFTIYLARNYQHMNNKPEADDVRK